MAIDHNKSALIVGKMMELMKASDVDNDTASLASRTLAGIVGVSVGTEKAVSELQVNGSDVTVIVLEGRRAEEFLTEDDKIKAEKDGEAIVGAEYEVRVGGVDPKVEIEKLLKEATDDADAGDGDDDTKDAASVHAISFEVLRLIARRGQMANLDPDVGVAAVLTMAAGIELVTNIRADQIKGETEDEQIDNFLRVFTGGIRSFAKVVLAIGSGDRPDDIAAFVGDIMSKER